MSSAIKIFVVALLSLPFLGGEARAFILDEEIFSQRPLDPLTARDDHGPLHRMPAVNATDFAPRYHYRFAYYFKAPEQLVLQRSYVGALQRELRRVGYYCGPIDGIFSAEVSDAIAHLQKNYSMRVTGTLTDAVRRALYLP
jgi:Putative peptidoglycan binding domain